MINGILTFFATPAFAQGSDYGLSATAGAADLTKFGTDLPTLIGNVLGTALSLIGVLFFALMLYGGVMWMIAKGNAEQEKKALETIVAAIIGILIVLGSYALTTFVFKSVGSANTTITQPPSPPPSGSCSIPADPCKGCVLNTQSGSCEKCTLSAVCINEEGVCAVDEELKQTYLSSCKNQTTPAECTKIGCEWK